VLAPFFPIPVIDFASLVDCLLVCLLAPCVSYACLRPQGIGDIEEVNGRPCLVCPWHYYKVCNLVPGPAGSEYFNPFGITTMGPTGMATTWAVCRLQHCAHMRAHTLGELQAQGPSKSWVLMNTPCASLPLSVGKLRSTLGKKSTGQEMQPRCWSPGRRV